MAQKLILKNFLPYRLSVLSNRVSGAISAIYQKRVDLSIPEWRVIAILGEAEPLTAGEVAEKTAMDKVAVSRAVARLSKVKYLSRRTDAKDKRRRKLTLTKKGRQVYETVVPLALDYEAALLENLSPSERASLDSLLAKLAGIQKKVSG